MITAPHARQAIRFSICDLALVLAAVSVTLCVCRERLVIGVAVGLALLGTFVIVVGRRSRRTGVVITGALLIIGAAVFFARQSLTISAWVGSHELDVHVIVVDASTLAPISNATVELFDGPYSPLEGPPPAVDRDFQIIPLENSNSLTTNRIGHTEFSHRFHAAGNAGLFADTGYVSTGNVWLRVTCSGYVTTHMPVDQQSARPRDINNHAPIWVTVPVGKD
ncbi:hypothetical protein ACFL2H_08055 [Planctomycetota bacterium]